MKIEYRFVNGEKASIDVSDDFEKIILELDRNLYNNNQTETRRHVSLDAFEQDKTMLKDTGLDWEDQILNRADKETLYRAISKLKPDEQELIHKIYLSEACVSLSEYAQSINVSENAVKQRLKRIRKKLKLICPNIRPF